MTWNLSGKKRRFSLPSGIWTQSSACPGCNVLCWARYTDDMYHLMPVKVVKFKCKNCGRTWVDEIDRTD